MAAQKKSIAFVTYPGMSLLELTGTVSVLKGLEMKGYQSLLVGRDTRPLDSDTPLQVIPDRRFSEAPDPAWLVVTGGGEASLRALEDPALRGYLQTAAERAEQIVTVGTGSLMLAELGLLGGQTATTHWSYAERLEERGAKYLRRPIVDEGRVVSAAGVSGGIEVGLYLLDKHAGRSLARMQQLFAEYDPEPPFGNIRWNQVPQRSV